MNIGVDIWDKDWHSGYWDWDKENPIITKNPDRKTYLDSRLDINASNLKELIPAIFTKETHSVLLVSENGSEDVFVSDYLKQNLRSNETDIDGFHLKTTEAVLAYYIHLQFHINYFKTPRKVLICEAEGRQIKLSLFEIYSHNEQVKETLLASQTIKKGGCFYLENILNEAHKDSSQKVSKANNDLREIAEQLIVEKKRIQGNYSQYLLEIAEEGEDFCGFIDGLTWKGKTMISYRNVYHAFDPIYREIPDAISNLLTGNDESVDEIVFTGSFSNFFLLQDTIVKILDLDDRSILVDENNDFSVKGACVLAKNMSNIERKIDYSIVLKHFDDTKSYLVVENEIVTNKSIYPITNPKPQGIIPSAEFVLSLELSKKGQTNSFRNIQKKITVGDAILGVCEVGLQFNHLLKTATLVLKNINTQKSNYIQLEEVYNF